MRPATVLGAALAASVLGVVSSKTGGSIDAPLGTVMVSPEAEAPSLTHWGWPLNAAWSGLALWCDTPAHVAGIGREADREVSHQRPY
jgi:hypothetical protein